jgi:hypothetical protein
MHRKRTALGLKVAVSALLIAGIAWKVDWREILGVAGRIDRWTWLAGWLGLVGGHAIGVLKWRANVNFGIASRASRLGVTDAVQCYSAGMFANLCLPSIVGGDALKAILAGRVNGRTEAAVVGGLVERLIDTLALLVLIVAGALASSETWPGWAQRVLQVGLLVPLVGGALLFPLLVRTRVSRIPRKLRRPGGRAMVAVRRMLDRPWRALIVFALSIAIQGWFVCLNAWLGRSIGIDAPFAAWLFAVPMTKAITLAPISFGGFGLREVTLAGFLEFLARVPHSDGVAASLLWQSMVIAIGLAGGVVWWVLGFRANARTGARHGPLVAQGDRMTGTSAGAAVERARTVESPRT